MRRSIGIPSTMDMYDTQEMFSRYPVDPQIAQRNVPPPWRVKIHEDGQARLLVMVQDCSRMILDAVIPLGRVRFSHIWIELDGPAELVEPLEGTSRALPTWYWYILPHQSDRSLVRALFGVAGAPAQLVERVSLGTRVGRSRPGAVRETTTAGYRWTEVAELYDRPDVVTGSHRFYRRYGRWESEAHARCFTHFLGEGTVRLEASDDSSIASLGFGTSLTGFSNPVWFRHCHVEYHVRRVRGRREERTSDGQPAEEAFIAQPRKVSPLLRPWNSLLDRLMRTPFVPARLMAWDPRTSFSWIAGSLYWLFPAGRARRALGKRIQDMVAITAAYTVNSPYCIADTVESEPTGLTSAEIEAIRTAADVTRITSFTPRERLAIQYARLVSSTPLEFPQEFVTELTAAFSEQEIVIMAALAAEVNRNARLFEALGAPPPSYDAPRS